MTSYILVRLHTDLVLWFAGASLFKDFNWGMKLPKPEKEKAGNQQKGLQHETSTPPTHCLTFRKAGQDNLEDGISFGRLAVMNILGQGILKGVCFEGDNLSTGMAGDLFASPEKLKMFCGSPESSLNVCIMFYYAIE
jgi:hypothetical protein